MVVKIGIPGGTATFPCITSCSIYDTITIDNVDLVNQAVGTYFYRNSNNYSTPAVAIDNRPDEVNVTGLEIIINSVPDTDIKRTIGNQWLITNHSIFLADHTNTRKNMEEMLIALSIIFAEFDAEYFYTSPGRMDLDVPQAVLQFRTHQLIRVKKQPTLLPNGSIDTNIPKVGGLELLD